MARTGILLLGYGGPDSLDAVAPFMCNLMGREPSPELVERTCRKYLTIGGASPITEIANSIGAKLQDSLAAEGVSVPIRVGMKYWNPYIAEAVDGLVAEGCDRIVTVALSPFEAKITLGAYREAVAAALEKHQGVEVVEAPLVSAVPEFLDYWAGAIATGLSDVEPNEGLVLLFSAHSLPESDLVADDPYVAGIRRASDAVAQRLGLEPGADTEGGNVLPGVSAFGSSKPPRAWFLGWQSKGARGGEWLGPDLDELIEAGMHSGVTGFIVAPIGFLTDHMETLYDLDVLTAEKVYDGDLEWVRVPVPNEHEILMDGVARVIKDLL